MSGNAALPPQPMSGNAALPPQPMSDNAEVPLNTSNASHLQHQDGTGAADTSVFRQRFLLWDKANTVDFIDENARKGNGYFLYECTLGGLCGGWADQIKGAVISYLIANITRRTFKCEFLKMQQCNLSNYLLPNRINWTMPNYPRGLRKHLNKTNHDIRRWIGAEWYKELIVTQNFTRLFNREPHIEYWYLHANMDFVTGLRNTKLYPEDLAWMRSISPADVYAEVYRYLFKLSPRLHSRLQDILADVLPTPRHRLVCIHVRMGHAGFHHDYQVRNHLENLPKIWSFVETLVPANEDRLFVMSDSQDVLKSAKNQSFSDKVFMIPGEIVHIDKYRKTNTSVEVACQSFERLVLEYHMLMNCDVLVRGHSGLSVIASAVRGSDKDLFCLLIDGSIVPCQRNNFTTFP